MNTFAVNFIVGTIVALALVGLGAMGGYRYAEGRCSLEREAAQVVVEENLTKALTAASDNIKAANAKAAKASKKYAALDAKHVEERKNYESLESAPGCRLDDASYRMLSDAIRRANSGDSRDDSR